MYEYLTGKIIELTPAYVILETGNIGYFINISVNTYSGLNGKDQCQLFIHQVVREDAHLLFGFQSPKRKDGLSPFNNCFRSGCKILQE